MTNLLDELLFGAVIVVALALCGYGTYHMGRTGAQHEAEIARQRVNIAQTAALNAARADAKHVEQLMQQTITDRDNALDIERAKHATEVSVLRATVRAGDVRLSVPVARCAIPASAAAASPAAVAAPGSEARTDLVPGTADAIFRLAGQSADDVRDYNEVIERFEDMRAVCNK